MKILITDDDPTNRMLLREMLGMLKVSIFEATTGKEAIVAAKQEVPDLILMDHTMPEMLGYDAMKEIRKDDRLKNTPFVMITGDFEIQEYQENDAVEKCAFLPKPYSLDQLFFTIGRAMGKKFPPADIK
ncbi:MAG: response regulator [Elusimicrobiota bacterium]